MKRYNGKNKNKSGDTPYVLVTLVAFIYFYFSVSNGADSGSTLISAAVFWLVACIIVNLILSRKKSRSDEPAKDAQISPDTHVPKWDVWDDSIHHADGQAERIKRAATQGFSILETSSDCFYDVCSSSGNVYHVSLENCTCPDFSHRKLPCKHMYYLAMNQGCFDAAAYEPEAQSSKPKRKMQMGRLSSSDIASCKDTFIAFDVETTGLNPDSDRIVELSAVRFCDFKSVDCFSTMIKADRPISDEAARVNGITEQDLENAPSESEAMKAFSEFIGLDALNGKTILVAHNAVFDLAFVSNALHRCGIEHALRCKDTLKISSRLLPDLSDHKLKTVAMAFGIVQNHAHRAEDDARVCGEIFVALIKRMNSKSEMHKK